MRAAGAPTACAALFAIVGSACSTAAPASEKISLDKSPLRITETMDDPATAIPPPGATSTPANVTSEAGFSICVACKADSYSPMTVRDESVVAGQVARMLGDLRDCLHRVGADDVHAVLHLRFDDNGGVMSVRVDVGGFEDLGCVKEISQRVPVLQASRGTTLHCREGCKR